MEPKTEDQIAQRLAQLPPDVREAVLSVEWEQKLQAIGEKYRLHIDQVGALGDLTLMTMLGLSGLDQYPARLAAELKVPPADAAAIAAKVNDQIFLPIRESMKSFNAPRTAAPVAPAPSAAPATVPATVQPPALAAAAKPDLAKADAMLSATTVQAAPPASPQATAPAPANAPQPPAAASYATDPYREPPIP